MQFIFITHHSTVEEDVSIELIVNSEEHIFLVKCKQHVRFFMPLNARGCVWSGLRGDEDLQRDSQPPNNADLPFTQ